LIIVVYVDDIIFGSNFNFMSKSFATAMHKEFEMYILRKLYFFLGLEIHQSLKGIYISQTKCLKEILRKFGMQNYAPVSIPMIT